MMRKTHDLVSKYESIACESTYVTDLPLRHSLAPGHSPGTFDSLDLSPMYYSFLFPPAGLACLRPLDQVLFMDSMDSEFVH